MDVPDSQLIADAQAGDNAAMSLLAQRWQGRAYALAYRLTLDRSDAEDIRQQAFLRVQRAIHRFTDQATFSTWLYRIVLNLCRDHGRSKQTRSRAMQVVGERSEVCGKGLGDTSLPEQHETNRRIADAMGLLPTVIHEIVIMRHYQGLKFTQIAEILDLPVSTVKSRMTVGLRLLRAQLEDIAP